MISLPSPQAPLPTRLYLGAQASCLCPRDTGWKPVLQLFIRGWGRGLRGGGRGLRSLAPSPSLYPFTSTAAKKSSRLWSAGEVLK